MQEKLGLSLAVIQKIASVTLINLTNTATIKRNLKTERRIL